MTKTKVFSDNGLNPSPVWTQSLRLNTNRLSCIHSHRCNCYQIDSFILFFLLASENMYDLIQIDFVICVFLLSEKYLPIAISVACSVE